MVENKIIVITGAGTGIGRALAAGFCADGAHVVGISRSESDLAATVEAHGAGRMHGVPGDVSNPGDVRRLFDETHRLHGRVDVLINNAAIYPRIRFLDSDIEEWASVIEINVVGMARCCHAALPGMLERGHGRILNVGSFAWKRPIPEASAYSASKGAVSALTSAIASEIDRDRFPDVLVNEFIPGIIRTRMTPDRGESPAEVYPHARIVASLPRGGPTGRTFLKGGVVFEDEERRGLLGRLKRILRGR